MKRRSLVSRAAGARSGALLTIFALAVSSFLVSAEAFAQTSVEGSWSTRLVTGTRILEGSLQLEQRGTSIEGFWVRAGDPDTARIELSGEVVDSTLTFSIDMEALGEEGTFEFVGHVDDEALMAGTFRSPEGTLGEWTARRETTDGVLAASPGDPSGSK